VFKKSTFQHLGVIIENLLRKHTLRLYESETMSNLLLDTLRDQKVTF